MNEVAAPPEIKPIKVEKKKPTGTKELSTIAKALDAIHDGMITFMDTVARSEEKETQIAARLSELTNAIKEEGCDDPEIREILNDIDGRVFEEQFYTEKGGGNVIRMTDDTKFSHLRGFASEAAKVSAAKFKMSADDYVPKSTVVHRLQRSIDIFRKVLKENVGPAAGEDIVKNTMQDIIEVWDEQE